jgi:Zn-dependent M28 family amino/carboxypeptidase
VAVAAVLVALAACTPRIDVFWLAGDERGGRNDGSQGSTDAQAWIVAQLQLMGAQPLRTDVTGREAYLQPTPDGTNVLGVIEGTDLAEEYVIVGAHYDGLGSCPTEDPADRICNGATDNATGVAAALEIGRRLVLADTPPRRSVILAFWDAEEDGLLGSRQYVQHPLVPLADTAAYVNFDIQGANLLPSLRSTTFAVGAESGGRALQALVASSAAPRSLQTEQLSALFGQGRSDYVNFLSVGIPTVFFSDSTGPCYHTAQDEPDVVDFAKLDEQIATAASLTRKLADADERLGFVADRPLATFDDAVTLAEILARGEPDRGLFSPEDQATYDDVRSIVQAIVDAGASAFDSDAQGQLLLAAVRAVSLLTTGVCTGFLP